jgi:hypothetical protein
MILSKNKILILLSCLFFSFAKEGDEIAAIDRCIAQTEQQLTKQRELKSLLVAYREKQEAFMKSQTKESAAEMVVLAAQILKMVEENNYQALFPTVYLEELRVFEMIAHKKAPARP